MTATAQLIQVLKKNAIVYHPIVPFDPFSDRLISLDLTAANSSLTEEILNNTVLFSQYMDNYLAENQGMYAIGGYAELRTMYSRSHVFDAGHMGEEPRRLHLGTDIWGKAGTTVFCPVGGMVHSCAMNNADGDYGATLILLHQLDGISFYTLYGHLSEADLSLSPGAYVNHGQELAHFGTPAENGNWPPHLHFQVIMDMELKEGDYPGVCLYSERDKYLANCPDPDLILQLNRFIK
jgi:murein DD-endopeptidase MepM/ murein hydrolase activator NlpD